MKSTVIKRSIVIDGRKTSVSMEEAFWSSFKQIAAAEDKSLADLATLIKAGRSDGGNLSSAVRVYVLKRFCDMARGLCGMAGTLEAPAAHAIAATREHQSTRPAGRP